MAVLTLPSEPASVSAARQFVRDVLASEEVDQVVATPAVLLASELVTNGVLHAETAIDLLVGIEGEALRVEVVDQGGGCPVAERPAPDAERGRGLSLSRGWRPVGGSFWRRSGNPCGSSCDARANRPGGSAVCCSTPWPRRVAAFCAGPPRLTRGSPPTTARVESSLM